MTKSVDEVMREAMEPQKVAFQASVIRTLDKAGIAPAHLLHGEELSHCDRSGYLVVEGGKRFCSLAIVGDVGLGEVSRQAVRDELAQKVRAALDAAGFRVRINEYGHVTAVAAGR